MGGERSPLRTASIRPGRSDDNHERAMCGSTDWGQPQYNYDWVTLPEELVLLWSPAKSPEGDEAGTARTNTAKASGYAVYHFAIHIALHCTFRLGPFKIR